MIKNCTIHLNSREEVTIQNVGKVDASAICVYLSVDGDSILFFHTIKQVSQLRNSLTTWLNENGKFEDVVKGAMDGDIVKETSTGTEADIGKVGPVGPNELDSW